MRASRHPLPEERRSDPTFFPVKFHPSLGEGPQCVRRGTHSPKSEGLTPPSSRIYLAFDSSHFAQNKSGLAHMNAQALESRSVKR